MNDEAPVCPGCGVTAPEGTYPAKSYDDKPFDWYCNACIEAKVQKAISGEENK